MARTLRCEIVTPERIVFSSEVLMVVATTTTGEIGILPLHMPLVSILAPGEVRLKFGEGAGDWESFSIAGGYIQVHEDKVIILADKAVATSEIDKERAAESKAEIERRLAELPKEAVDERDQCERDLAWCNAQLHSVEKQLSV